MYKKKPVAMKSGGNAAADRAVDKKKYKDEADTYLKGRKKRAERESMDKARNMLLDMAGVQKKKYGGSLKSVPEGNKGLSKLPTDVRNKMGYMKRGGSVKKMGMGGKCRGMGAATRGGNFVRNG